MSEMMAQPEVVLTRRLLPFGDGLLPGFTTKTEYQPSECVAGKEYSMPRRFQGLGEYVTVMSHFN